MPLLGPTPVFLTPSVTAGCPGVGYYWSAVTLHPPKAFSQLYIQGHPASAVTLPLYLPPLITTPINGPTASTTRPP
ncbi:hypothetical protein N658DRAFT_211607 [Parathielavia hyrcaniae]|uniref:Uncharacterized protein n=1 Tax=Parathielavia hyrcaniae TaxID=113614 RepID=A0AAN6PVQ9_9PEZI|nr:hypothetical protein N658DRAFT_211607 [Parathielavia hyrcaniae]